MRHTRSGLPLGVLLLLLRPLPTLTQTVRGYVLESGSDEPIVLAEVTLLDTAMAVVDQTFSAHDGAFLLKSPEPGSFYVRVGALGYRTKLDGIVELAEGGILPIAFFLVPEPVAVEGIEATAERQKIEEYLELQGFYDRKQAGFGHFITPEEIEKRNVRDYVRLFQHLPVEVEGGVGATVLHIRGRCQGESPTVWLDGALVDLGWNSSRYGGGRSLKGVLEEVVQVSDIRAVELYMGPASTPLQWVGQKMLGQCGTVVIWTTAGGG